MTRPPLELVIHPRPRMKRHHRGPAPYLNIASGDLISEHAAGMFAGAKRLADAELSAEWHRHDHTYDLLTEGIGVETFGNDYIRGSAYEERTLKQRNTLHRFAAAPHYYEEQE